jgi:hypothetical protein
VNLDVHLSKKVSIHLLFAPIFLLFSILLSIHYNTVASLKTLIWVLARKYCHTCKL